MKNVARRTSTLGFLVLLVLAATVSSQGQVPLDRQVGEIFVAVGNGQYQVWHPTPPTATLVETIDQNFNNIMFSGATAGCAFDPTYHPFTTNLFNGDVFRHAIDDPQNAIEQISVAGAGGAQPTSIAFDSAGNSYVGNAGGNGLIEEYSPSGTLVRTLPVNTNKLKGGSAWIDLSADGKTIYFTGTSNTISQFAVSSSNVSKFASISGATLYALRVLPTATANGGILLVAAVFSGSSNIQLLNNNGHTVQTYSVAGQNNFQILTLDPNGTSFWAGNPTTGNFYRINLASGNIEVSANTGISNGPTGLCAYGGFSATLYQPISVKTSFTSSSSPGCAVNAQNSSLADCTFSSLVPDPIKGPNHFAVTLKGINFGYALNGLQLTYNYSQIAQSAGTSDTGLLCELTSPDRTKCEVHSVDIYPNNGSSDTNIYQGWDTDNYSTQSSTNPVVLKNESHPLTDFVIHGSTRSGGSDTTLSILTVNEQPIRVAASQSCGYISPLINSQYNSGRTIPVKFQAVTPPNTCATGPYMANLNPRLVLLQISTTGAAPYPVSYTLTNSTTTCPATGCYYRLDPTTNTWILNVDSSSLQGGGTTYFGTTFDDSNQIPSFSNTTGGLTITDYFTVN